MLGGMSMSGYPINAQQRSGAHQFINSPDNMTPEQFAQWYNTTWAQNNIGRMLDENLLTNPMGQFVEGGMAGTGQLPQQPTNFQTGQPGVNDMTGGPGHYGTPTNNQGTIASSGGGQNTGIQGGSNSVQNNTINASDFTGTSTTMPMPMPNMTDADLQAVLQQYGIATDADLSGLMADLGTFGVSSMDDFSQITSGLNNFMTGEDVNALIGNVLSNYGIGVDDVMGDGETTAYDAVTSNATDLDSNTVYGGTGSTVGSTTAGTGGGGLNTEVASYQPNTTTTPTPTKSAPSGFWAIKGGEYDPFGDSTAGTPQWVPKGTQLGKNTGLYRYDPDQQMAKVGGYWQPVQHGVITPSGYYTKQGGDYIANWGEGDYRWDSSLGYHVKA